MRWAKVNDQVMRVCQSECDARKRPKCPYDEGQTRKLESAGIAKGDRIAQCEYVGKGASDRICLGEESPLNATQGVGGAQRGRILDPRGDTRVCVRDRGAWHIQDAT